MSSRNALLLSSSNCHGHKRLEFAGEEITSFLKGKNVSTVLFIPYALSNYDAYTELITVPFKKFGFNLKSIHTFKDPEEAISKAEAFYVGGGNTFMLLNSLYEKKIISRIYSRVWDGVPYIGASAGTNVATVNICTTNDMPIIYPPSFNGIGLLPFNINPHYLDPVENSTFKGETRDERINQYHELPGTPPVLALREGSMLHLADKKLTLKGFTKAKLFIREKDPVEFEPNSDLSFLLE